MSANRQSREMFATHFDTLKFDADVDDISNDETLVPSSLEAFKAEVDGLTTLPRMAVRAPGKSTLNPDLDVLGTLGEGGMGLVRLAEQVSLKRNVAVKTLRTIGQEKSAQALLKEAYVTGHLEHPNVVPVYTLGRDDEGAPLIVMKRIEGREWLDILDTEHASGAVDLERHLEILEQVCNAIRFAHSRGIVHRDIKPENVMIGGYDEVYLLDWGIAVSLDDEQSLLPRRSEAIGVAGTPSYMAPEMTRDDASEVEERTDVYLLGATLHHILTGRPRHVGDSVFDAMFSACRSEPFEYGPGVPAGLAAIANRACALEPNDRFESAAAFRQALHEWRDHRGSIEVAREALQSLETLTARLDTERSAESDVVIHDLAGECRFGFRQALRMWPNNDVAQEGERRFLERMLDFYVSSEQAGAARATLAELGDRAGPDMVARVDALERELAAKRRKVDKLEKMADELDLRTAATSRSRLALMLGVLWTLSTSYAAYSVHHGPQVTNDIRIEEHLIMAIRSVLIVAVSVFIFRKRIFANLANRRLIYILFSVMFTMIMMRTVFWLTNTPYVGAQAAEITLYGMACVVLGIVTDLRIVALSALFFVPAILGAVFPQYQLWILVPFNLLVFFGLAWVWSPGRMDRKLELKRQREGNEP